MGGHPGRVEHGAVGTGVDRLVLVLKTDSVSALDEKEGSVSSNCMFILIISLGFPVSHLVYTSLSSSSYSL